jgi:hypothetical protein
MSPAAQRPRIDLDGVALVDPERPGSNVIAVFRHRTTEGLVILMPESGELVVPWAVVQSAALDLASGALRIDLDPRYTAQEVWLRGAKSLTGRWLDRFTMRS